MPYSGVGLGTWFAQSFIQTIQYDTVKYPDLVRTQIEIISDLKLFSSHVLIFRKFRRVKSARIALEFIFFVSQVFNIQNAQ